MIFDIENSLWTSNFCTLRRAVEARQSIPGRLWSGGWLILYDCLKNWVDQGVASQVNAQGPCITLLLVCEKVMLFRFGLMKLWTEHLAKSLIPSPLVLFWNLILISEISGTDFNSWNMKFWFTAFFCNTNFFLHD